MAKSGLAPGSGPYDNLTANFGGFLAVPSALSTASSVLLVSGQFNNLLGFTVSEVSGNASQTVTFYDGATSSAANPNFGRINLAPNQTITQWLPNGGWNASSGNLYLGVGVGGGTPSGLVAGAVIYS